MERAVRASDDDRERVTRQLTDHAAAGRLSPEELDERIEAAYAARTNRELDALLVDLPAPSGPRPPDPARQVARRRLAHHAGASSASSCGWSAAPTASSGPCGSCSSR